MKKFFYLIFFILIFSSIKAEIKEDVTVTELLDNNYIVSEKFIPNPFDGYVYFVMHKEKDSDKSLNTEELANYISRIKDFNLSRNHDDLIKFEKSDLYYKTEIILCRVSMENTKCKKP
tara:strand:- start:504 stop:857 length:354 start_codon:yes stop_codon:yes gene_type:complete